jgi:6-pyruvoyltetrahydropterin/6-carboxytetrahydropterin synthase
MPEIKIIDRFSAAHNLRNYHGKCEELHGHNWQIEVTVGRKGLDKNGMIMDFSELKKLTKGILYKLDHSYLNEINYFKSRNPTSENIVLYIAAELKKRLKRPLALKKVKVWETNSSCAIWP